MHLPIANSQKRKQYCRILSSKFVKRQLRIFCFISTLDVEVYQYRLDRRFHTHARFTIYILRNLIKTATPCYIKENI